MEELSWQSWFTLAVVVGMFASLMFTKIKAEMAFLGTVILLFFAGVLDAKAAFGGFSAESVLVVAILYVVIAGITSTGVLTWIVNHLMGTPKSLSRAIIRLMLPVALFSSVLSNTTVVALFINVVKKWAQKLNIAPSKLLIPMSYASCLGGIITLIGTPPNLIIASNYAERTGETLGILTPAIPGLFCLVVGIVAILLMQKLLPTRQSPMQATDVDDFTAELNVPANSPFVGMTIDEAIAKGNMDKNKDVRLVAIRRFDNEFVTPIAPSDFVMGGDRAIVSGSAKSIKQLAQTHNLTSPLLQSMIDNEISEGNFSGKTILSSIIMLLMVILPAVGVMSMMGACLLAAAAMVICKCCTSSQALKSIDWNIIIIFACSVAIGKAIENTGLAQVMANNLMAVCGSSPFIVLFMLCLAGTFITEFISNTACAAIFFPIAMSAAETLGANPVTFCVALMIAVSSSFATPIGSPTHMLIYVPGGYRFADFMLIGIPMNFIILIANVFIVSMLFPF